MSRLAAQDVALGFPPTRKPRFESGPWPPSTPSPSARAGLSSRREPQAVRLLRSTGHVRRSRGSCGGQLWPRRLLYSMLYSNQLRRSHMRVGASPGSPTRSDLPQQPGRHVEDEPPLCLADQHSDSAQDECKPHQSLLPAAAGSLPLVFPRTEQGTAEQEGAGNDPSDHLHGHSLNPSPRSAALTVQAGAKPHPLPSSTHRSPQLPSRPPSPHTPRSGRGSWRPGGARHCTNDLDAMGRVFSALPGSMADGMRAPRARHYGPAAAYDAPSIPVPADPPPGGIVLTAGRSLR
jgi:hypothetical protein